MSVILTIKKDVSFSHVLFVNMLQLFGGVRCYETVNAEWIP